MVALFGQLNLSEKQMQEVREVLGKMAKERVTEFVKGSGGRTVAPLREETLKALKPILTREQNQKLQQLLSKMAPEGRPEIRPEPARPQLGQGRDGFRTQFGPMAGGRDGEQPQMRGPAGRFGEPNPQPRPEVREPRIEHQAAPSKSDAGAEDMAARMRAVRERALREQQQAAAAPAAGDLSVRVLKLVQGFLMESRSATPEQTRKMAEKLAKDIQDVVTKSAGAKPAVEKKSAGEKPATEKRPEPTAPSGRGEGRPGFGGMRMGPGGDRGPDGARPMMPPMRRPPVDDAD